MLSINDINLLKSQNEGLKKQNEELQKENKILQNRNQQLDGATTTAKCYEKALSEIENINKETCKICKIFSKCNKEYSNCKTAKILNIISKAKHGNNATNRQ